MSQKTDDQISYIGVVIGVGMICAALGAGLVGLVMESNSDVAKEVYEFEQALLCKNAGGIYKVNMCFDKRAFNKEFYGQ